MVSYLDKHIRLHEGLALIVLSVCAYAYQAINYLDTPHSVIQQSKMTRIVHEVIMARYTLLLLHSQLRVAVTSNLNDNHRLMDSP